MTIKLRQCPHKGHGHFNPFRGSGKSEIRGNCPHCNMLIDVKEYLQKCGVLVTNKERKAA